MTSAAGNVEALWARTVFGPVPARNAFEVTVERLVQGIRLGVLTDGTRLPPERQLAESFGVSRMTLREAIKALRDANLVESRRGRGGGTFVVAAPIVRARNRNAIGREVAEDLEDALALRRIVEAGAARLAATRTLSSADRAGLQAYLTAATDCTPATRRQCDSRLHLAIAALGGSSAVTTAVADVQMRLDELLRAIPVIATNIAHSNAQHAAVVTAILRGDPDAALCAMEEHVDGTSALLRGFLSRPTKRYSS